MNSDQIMARAAMADCLDARIAQNTSAQQVDLNQWIFDRVPPKPGTSVLELCCGTGAQTRFHLKHVGPSGKVTATDVSAKALSSLGASVSPEERSRLTLLESDLDTLPQKLAAGGRQFDTIFCAYGLYYSKNATALLSALQQTLSPGGRVVVVGPFGPNNGFLFDFLGKHGVKISDYVLHTSSRFMWSEVIPWATTHFRSLRVETLTNAVRWKSADAVMAYWQNSTFFDESRRSTVAEGLESHFRTHSEFVNDKWIMLAEMTARISDQA